MRHTKITLAAGIAACGALAGAQTQEPQVVRPVRVQTNTATRAVVAPRQGTSLVYGTQGTPYAVAAGGIFDSTKVSPDLDNVKVGDAIKRVLEGAGKQVEVDGDVPDVRVSLKAKDIRLSTFMDLMSQAAGVGWSVGTKDGKSTYRFGKNLQPFGNWIFDGNSAKALRVWEDGKNKSLFNNLNKGNSFVFTDPGTGLSTFKNYLGVESRISVVCPHCKGRVTAIQKKTAPQCAKCSRVFQAGWDYCPVDGTKRPAESATEWKHCPLCGKDVDFSKAEKKTTLAPNVPAPVVEVDALTATAASPAKP